MINVTMIDAEGIAILEPDARLSAGDFQRAAKVIDPWIDAHGRLNGLIIHVRAFPGWESFAALLEHLRFVRDHHRKVTHIALVTDSPVGELAEHIAGHFVRARVRCFPFDDFVAARQWIAAG